MAKKKQPVVVTITKGKHKTQPYTVRIEGGKTDTILSQRYTRLHSAKIGALRKLDAHTITSAVMPGVGGNPGRGWGYTGGYAWQTPDGREIQFVVKPKTTKSK